MDPANAFKHRQPIDIVNINIHNVYASAPIELFSHCGVIMRPHTVPDLVTRCCPHWSISSAINTLQCNKRSNVKRRFGYALNFFHRELNSCDVFRFSQYYLHCVLLTVTVTVLKNFRPPILSIYWLLTFCCKQVFVPVSFSVWSKLLVESRLYLWCNIIQL